MPQHYTKLTTQAAIFCRKCMKETPWRIADGRRQYCLTCYERERADHGAEHKPTPTYQPSLLD